MYQVSLKPWADGRLKFLQVRRSGKVVFGVVFDSSSADQRRVLDALAGAIASCFSMNVNDVKEVLRRS